MLKVNFYKNKRQGHKNYGKIYCRADNAAPVGIAELAQHMSEHDTPYSTGAIQGILTDMVKCIRELMLLGQPVKLDNLAIFKASIQCKPANDIESFDLKANVKNVKLTAVATGKLSRTELSDDAFLGYSSLAKRIKAGELILSDVKGEYISEVGGQEEEPTVNP